MENVDFLMRRTSQRSADVVNPIVLEENGDHRKVFIAVVNDSKTETGETVGGAIVHQRKNRRDEWENVESLSLSNLRGGECVKMNLRSSATKKLYDHLTYLYQVDLGEVSRDVTALTVGRVSDMIRVPTNLQVVINQLIEQEHGVDVWKELVRSKPELARQLALGQIQLQRAKALGEFRYNLDRDVTESVWSEFFEENTWIFGYGLDYRFLRILQREVRIGSPYVDGSGGSRGDFLLGDSRFTVLVEIKKANTPLFGERLNRAGAWCLSHELMDAVSQIQCQKAEWLLRGESPDIYDGQARLDYLTCDPKCMLIIGNRKEFLGSNRDAVVKARSFELFRRDLGRVEVITFDELFDRASFIVDQERAQLQPEDVLHDDLPF